MLMVTKIFAFVARCHVTVTIRSTRMGTHSKAYVLKCSKTFKASGLLATLHGKLITHLCFQFCSHFPSCAQLRWGSQQRNERWAAPIPVLPAQSKDQQLRCAQPKTLVLQTRFYDLDTLVYDLGFGCGYDASLKL